MSHTMRFCVILSTGSPSKIHISSATASLLIIAGKSHWVKARDDQVDIKGKGLLNTYWLCLKPRKSSSCTESSQNDCISNSPTDDSNNDKFTFEEQDRLVRWICELLLVHMKNLAKTRKPGSTKTRSPRLKAACETSCEFTQGNIPLDEIVETLMLPVYQKPLEEEDSVEIDNTVILQLHKYITAIASTYRNNPFHNFKHACHVTMSVSKLLMRVVTPDVDFDDSSDVESHLYDYTYGISSDPITLLAILLSAVIHDADHRGVSNTQLIKEEERMSKVYRNKSIAEQNSLDIAWNLLMSEDFDELRNWWFPSDAELRRFRQVLVNLVLATDIFDKELNDLRKSRWNKAFSTDESTCSSDVKNLRATIVIEHVIQASDVAHTMQHWHVYRKWNKLLFMEMYLAYRHGRMTANPSDFWYQGELSFFDNYIIPLAKKLKECCVFGVSSDEYLNYAEQNRAEWELRGQEIVNEMIAEVKHDEDAMEYDDDK
jgi:3'5'-cyclic nucleotide phosphodiesterase